MKIIRYIFLLAVLLSADLTSQKNIDSSYFPLSVGNRWYYNEFGRSLGVTFEKGTLDYSELWEVTEKRNIYGMEFFLIVRTYYDSFNGKIKNTDSMYYTFSNSKILRLSPSKIDDSSSVGLWVDFSNSRRQFVIADRIYEQTILRYGDSIIVVQQWMPGWMDSGSEKSFTKGIGITSLHSYFRAGETCLIRREIH